MDEVPGSGVAATSATEVMPQRHDAAGTAWATAGAVNHPVVRWGLILLLLLPQLRRRRWTKLCAGLRLLLQPLQGPSGPDRVDQGLRRDAGGSQLLSECQNGLSHRTTSSGLAVLFLLPASVLGRTGESAPSSPGLGQAGVQRGGLGHQTFDPWHSQKGA